jgi:uncharacterized protein (DUF1800 family)
MNAISRTFFAVIGSLFLSVLFVQEGHTGTIAVDQRRELETVEAKVRAAQFLTRATFGPTQPQIDQLASEVEQLGELGAFAAWIDRQFEMPPSQHHALTRQMILDDGYDLLDSGVRPGAYREFAWWHIALTGEDQLRQRMAWALYQIAPVNTDAPGAFERRLDASGQPAYLGLSNYYDMLVRNAFGNYRDLLLGITLHPVMGVFLSHAQNPKGVPEIGQFPDENFAREVMQLFSIGLYELRPNGRLEGERQNKPPIETYDNFTIEAMARVFTGLSFAGIPFDSRGRNYHEPMQMFDDYHDTDSKTILSNVVLPANQPGMQDISDTMDTIAQHPNVGPFIARLLIQRFVKSNPTSAYIQSVAEAFADNGAGVRGDMRAVIKAVLLHPEALNSLEIKADRKAPALLVSATDTERSRLREPILRYTAFLRAFNPGSTHPTGRLLISNVMDEPLQTPYRVPSVFSFYDPDYAPAGSVQAYETSKKIPGGRLSAPEFEIMTPNAITAMNSLLYKDIKQGGHDGFYTTAASGESLPYRIALDFTEQQNAADIDELMEQLNILLCRGAMSDAARDAIIPLIQKGIWSKSVRTQAAVLMTVTAPDCVVVQ